ncbi:MAG: peptidoglycan-binding protein [Microcoleaceae cyanobacterium]
MKSKIVILFGSICLMLLGTVPRAMANVRNNDKTDPQKLNEWVSPLEESQTELLPQPTVSADQSQSENSRWQPRILQQLQQEFVTPESETESFSQPIVPPTESGREFTTQETQPVEQPPSEYTIRESETEPFSQPFVSPTESGREFTTQETQPVEQPQSEYTIRESETESFSQPFVSPDESGREFTTQETQPVEQPKRGFFNRNPQTDLFSQPFYEGSQTPIRRRVIERGTEGAQVRGLQQRLQVHGFYDAEIDSMFGPRTESAVIAFQQANGIEVTGLVERDTWKALETDPTPTLLTEVLAKGDRGSKVRTLQTRLQAKGYDPGPVDGVYGGLTESAVMAYQQAKALDASGVVDDTTWTTLSQEWLQ